MIKNRYMKSRVSSKLENNKNNKNTFCKLGKAPFSSKSLTISKFPVLTALINKVSPF